MLFLQTRNLVLNCQEFLENSGSLMPLSCSRLTLYILIYVLCLPPPLPHSCHFMGLWEKGEADGCLIPLPQCFS